MKFFFAVLFLFHSNVFCQRVINNPDFIGKNISGDITKVELTDKETIIHFHLRIPIGGWFSIPHKTYIEDASGEGGKMYILNAEGIVFPGKNYMVDSDEIRYKLHFPLLSKDVKKINYGEANTAGNWFIYKLNLTRHGRKFLNGFGKNKSNDSFQEITKQFQLKTYKKSDEKLGTILPKDLPNNFFGSWYDKYGTLLFITTPDYLFFDKRIQYYYNIQQVGDNKFKIDTPINTFEILSLDGETMTIRTNRIVTLTRKPSYKKMPDFMKGKWLNRKSTNEITITDNYFYNRIIGKLNNVKSRVVHIAESGNGDFIWFVLHNASKYEIYFASKKDGEFVLHPKAHANADFIKI